MALSDLGTGSHNLVGEVHENNKKKNGKSRGLSRSSFGVAEEDRDKSHLGKPGRPLGGGLPFLCQTFIGFPVCQALCWAPEATKDSDGAPVTEELAASQESLARE